MSLSPPRARTALVDRPPLCGCAAQHREVIRANAPVSLPSTHGGLPSGKTGPPGDPHTDPPWPGTARRTQMGLGCPSRTAVKTGTSQALVGLQGLWGLLSHHPHNPGSSGEGVDTMGDGYLCPRGRGFQSPLLPQTPPGTQGVPEHPKAPPTLVAVSSTVRELKCELCFLAFPTLKRIFEEFLWK